MPRLVTPLVATHRVLVHYQADTLSHTVHYLCSAVPASVTPSGFNFVTGAGAPIEVDAGVQALASFLKAMFDPSALLDTYELQEYVSGAYVPVWAGGIGLAGTTAATRSVANRGTTVFRDGNNILVRDVLLGISALAPQRLPVASLSGPFAAYINELKNGVSGHTGTWLTGRSGTRLAAALNLTISLDRKSRRRLGLV